MYEDKIPFAILVQLFFAMLFTICKHYDFIFESWLWTLSPLWLFFMTKTGLKIFEQVIFHMQCLPGTFIYGLYQTFTAKGRAEAKEQRQKEEARQNKIKLIKQQMREGCEDATLTLNQKRYLVRRLKVELNVAENPNYEDYYMYVKEAAPTDEEIDKEIAKYVPSKKPAQEDMQIVDKWLFEHRVIL